MRETDPGAGSNWVLIHSMRAFNEPFDGTAAVSGVA